MKRWTKTAVLGLLIAAGSLWTASPAEAAVSACWKCKYFFLAGQLCSQITTRDTGKQYCDTEGNPCYVSGDDCGAILAPDP